MTESFLRPEDALQCQVADFLRRFTDPHKVLWWHTANERQTSKARGAKLKRAGVLAGVADLVIMYRDTLVGDPTVLFVELKSARGRLTDSQKEFCDRAVWVGADYEVVRSLDEFTAVLNRNFVPLTTRLAA